MIHSGHAVTVILHVSFFSFLTGISLLFLMSITCQELEHLEFFEPLELFQLLKVRTGQGCNVDYVAEYRERFSREDSVSQSRPCKHAVLKHSIECIPESLYSRFKTEYRQSLI